MVDGHQGSSHTNKQLAAARARVQQLEHELAQARSQLSSLELNRRTTGEPYQADIPPLSPETSSFQHTDATSSLQEKLDLFQHRFVGRQDAYATRWVSRKTLRAGWSPAVRGGFYTDQKTDADLLPLTPQVVERHLRGSDASQSEFHVGLYPLTVNNQCKLLACDFDGETWQTDAAAFAHVCDSAGVSNLVEISRSGNGAHVWIFFATWIPAAVARAAGMVLLRRTIQQNSGMSLKSYDRFFPAQDVLPVNTLGRRRLGNLIALPLQGNRRRGGTTVFANPKNWEPYEDQFLALASTTPVPEHIIQGLAAEETKLGLGPKIATTTFSRPERKELRSGLTGTTINIRRSAMLHIPTENLPSAFISELKHRASIPNPEFYRRQAQRFSTFGIPRLVTSFEHDHHELRIPRGLADETRGLLKQAGARVVIRNTGKRPSRQEASFTGRLQPTQDRAVQTLLQHQDGVLVAPPGFGKTVMACALIAERRVPTAILVNRAELLHQWRDRLTQFLAIEDQQIGQLGGGRRKRKGFIDLIMMQSISRKGADPKLLEDYGQIIIDECHAAAAPATEAALRTVNVKYWTGLTATPFRADGMDELITMQCGPIRHVMEAPVQIDRQLVSHLTSFTTDEPGTDGPSIQEIYSELSLDPERNHLIVEEISTAAAGHRNCLVLTNRVAHLQALYNLLKSRVNTKIFTLHGQLSAEDRNRTRRAIAQTVAQNAPFILIAIDKIAGEGLDIPALNTLFLTMPVSFKGRIIQQAGRITRGTSRGPENAVVHDFRDLHVPMLERMYRRRSKILQKEGFSRGPILTSPNV